MCANVVGYTGTEFEHDAQNLKGGSFTAIGLKDAAGNECIRLSDIRCTGYEESVGGCWGNIFITVLKKNGGNEKMTLQGGATVNVNYYWYDAEGEYEAGWYGPDDQPMWGGQSEGGDAEDITFAVGEGINVTCDGDWVGCQLVSNGQVVQDKRSFLFTHDAQNLVANPLCREITLSELTCTGYEESVGGCWGNIFITVLKKNGGNEKMTLQGGATVNVNYYWYDAEGEYEAGWYGPDDQPMWGGQSEGGDAEDIVIGIGEGLNITVDGDWVGCQIDFPSLGLK